MRFRSHLFIPNSLLAKKMLTVLLLIGALLFLLYRWVYVVWTEVPVFRTYRYYDKRTRYWADRKVPGPEPEFLLGNLRAFWAPGKPRAVLLKEWTEKYGKVSKCFGYNTRVTPYRYTDTSKGNRRSESSLMYHSSMKYSSRDSKTSTRQR